MSYGTNGLTFKTLRDANVARLRETPTFARCENWTTSQWLQALVGEVGELANLMKKIDRGDSFDSPSKIDRAVRNEIADIQTYLDLLATALRVDLGAATIEKWNEVSERVGSDIRINADDWHRVRAPG